MRKTFCLSGIIILLISLGMQPAFADTEGPSISLNGTQLEMKAFVQEGSLYLPVRSISEDLGYVVSWSPTDQTVGIDAKDKTISLDLKNTKINANRHQSYMQYTPVMINDRTYMREDFFSDNLALKVEWDKNNNIVLLTSMKENAITIKTFQIYSETKALKTAIQYPVVVGLADQKIQDEINATFKNLADQAAQEGAKNAADLAPAVIQFPDMPGQCEVYFNYQIKYNQNGLLSLVFQNYQYAGGAHGNTVQTGYTMNLKTGQQCALKDLFKANADYVSIISNSVKTQLDERDLTAALFQPFSKINENQGYYLSDNGIVVYFQQYEILPYAAGIQEFTVDYSLLTELLKEPDLTKDNPNDLLSKRDPIVRKSLVMEQVGHE